MQPIKSGRQNAPQWLWAFCLVLSLLLSQTLGHLHAVKHGAKLDSALAAAQVTNHDRDGSGFLDLLFVSHSSHSDCRLYDQLSDGQAMPLLVVLPLPIVLPSQLVAIFAGNALARWAALFDARGPPLTV